MRRRDLVITTLAALLIWQIIAMLVQRDILPTPIAVAQSFIENFGEIMRHFIASGLRVTIRITSPQTKEVRTVTVMIASTLKIGVPGVTKY